MAITIREIAAQAGVTKSTVSKVLNDRPGVGDQTRKRIKAIMNRTGFKPSSSARALARGNTENIGLLVPRESGFSLSGAYWSALTSAIALEAADCGYNVLLLTPEKEGGEEELVENLVRNGKAEGLIIGHPRLAKNSLTLLAQHDFPFVTIGRNPGWESWAIDVDNAGGARDMTSYMHEQGYQDIAMITGPESLFHMRERGRGFRESLASHGRSPSGLIHSEFDQSSVHKAVSRLLNSEGRMKADALFIGSGGEFLCRIFRAMEEYSISRDNIGLAVFDDYSYLEFTGPGITAVRQPTEELGRRAVEILDSRIIGKERIGGPVILPTQIIPRKSCGE